MPTVSIPPSSGNANAATTSASPTAEAAMTMPTVQVAFRQKVEREIRRYGVEQAMKRWRVMCDYLQTEDWWPAVVRDVETVFDAAYEERNRQQAERDGRQNPASIQLNVNQQQSNLDTNNHFGKDSQSQVFNGDVNGRFDLR